MGLGDWIRRIFRGGGSAGGRSDPDGPAPATSPVRGDDPEDDEPWEMPDVVELPITDELDLHAFRPREIRDLVDGYLHEARAAGFEEVRVIHGKGKGVQRDIVHALCREHPAVTGYRLAGGRSGWGATLVTLRPPDEE